MSIQLENLEKKDCEKNNSLYGYDTPILSASGHDKLYRHLYNQREETMKLISKLEEEPISERNIQTNVTIVLSKGPRISYETSKKENIQ